MCKCVLSPGDNPNAVNKYIISYCALVINDSSTVSMFTAVTHSQIQRLINITKTVLCKTAYFKGNRREEELWRLTQQHQDVCNIWTAIKAFMSLDANEDAPSFSALNTCEQRFVTRFYDCHLLFTAPSCRLCAILWVPAICSDRAAFITCLCQAFVATLMIGWPCCIVV